MEIYWKKTLEEHMKDDGKILETTRKTLENHNGKSL